jgi:transcriptional antiterminator NusG
MTDEERDEELAAVAEAEVPENHVGAEPVVGDEPQVDEEPQAADGEPEAADEEPQLDEEPPLDDEPQAVAAEAPGVDLVSALDEALAGPVVPPMPAGIPSAPARTRAEPAAPQKGRGRRKAEMADADDEEALEAARRAAEERARIEAMIPADAKWYVIHTYAGYENKVKQNLEHRIESMGMLDQIFQVVVPIEEEVDIKDGQRRIVERKIFPGYVLVRMILSEESWGVVRNTPAVTGFVGSGTQPTALRPEDVDKILRRMEADEPTIRVTFRQGQNVRIVDGPFTDFHGIVDDIDMDRGKVRLMVNFFGRETPVELDFLQVEKV